MTERDTAFGRVNIPGILGDGRFIPKWWQEAIGARLDRAILGTSAPTRHGHREPPTAAAVEAFEKWKQNYERILEHGHAREWLTWGYEPDEITAPRGEWVWDEPEADFEARRTAWLEQLAPDGFIRIPTASREDS